MKQTIEIEVPDGKVISWEDFKIVYKDALPLLPKTWEEYRKNYMDNISTYFYKSSITDVPNDIALQHIALIQLHQLRDYYRQGWTPNWLDNNSKWGIFNRRNEIRVQPIVNWAGFLSFQTEELATEFLNNFRDLIEQAKDLI